MRIPLVSTAAYETGGMVSPDGRWLAYYADDAAGQPHVYVRPFPDVDGGRWLVSPAGGSRALWSRNGDELFYLDADSFLTAVSMQTTPAVSFGKPRRLLDRTYYTPDRTTRTYDVSPDGQRFLMIKELPESSDAGEAASAGMMIVLNWQEELKRLVPTR